MLFMFFFPAWVLQVSAEQPSNVYVTWENMEIDKCASAWLIKRFVDKSATFRFYPKGKLMPEGIPFDVPQAEIRRYHNMAAFEFILHKYDIDDQVLQNIGKIIHDIEINYWGRKRYEESKKINKMFQKIMDSSNSTEECLERGLTLFDSLYSTIIKSPFETGEGKKD